MRRVLLALVCGFATVATGQRPQFKPDIPKVWDDREMAQFELPLVVPEVTPKHVPAEYYYRIPVRTIYKSYSPIVRGQNFEEYINRLRQEEPEIAFDVQKLRTREDWIRAGKAVFEAPTQIISNGVRPTSFLGRYVVRTKGQVDLGNFSCANCHVRRLQDGTIIAGAQEYFTQGTPSGNLPAAFLARLKQQTPQFFATPWLQPDPNISFTSEREFIELNRVFPGTRTRMGTSLPIRQSRFRT